MLFIEERTKQERKKDLLMQSDFAREFTVQAGKKCGQEGQNCGSLSKRMMAESLEWDPHWTTKREVALNCDTSHVVKYYSV